MNGAIYRYEVPVDDRWYVHELSGGIKHVDCRRHGVVEFWALHSGGPTVRRAFRVFGTGQPLPERVEHRGTALDGGFVWHLMESADPDRTP